MTTITPRDPPPGKPAPVRAGKPAAVRIPKAPKAPAKMPAPNIANNNLLTHPTSTLAKQDRLQERENLARQLRTNQMMREQAREMIKPSDIITEIQAIDLLMQGNKDIAGNSIPMEQTIITALRARADIKFRLLNKVMPDLKATESISHSTHDHQHAHAHTTVSNMELATRLQLWRRTHDLEPMEDVISTIEPDPPAGCTSATPTFDVEDFL